MYKHMNEHFGQRIFKHARFKYPEAGTEAGGGFGGAGASGTTSDSGQTQNDGTSEADRPSYDDLLKELAAARTESAQAKADRERYKTSIDDLTKKNKELTTQVRERMTAEEQLDAAQKEAFEALQAENKQIKQKMEIIDNTSFWVGKTIGMDEELAKSTAEAEATGDKDKFRENIAKHIKSIKDSAYQQALKDRPDVSAGNGSGNNGSLATELALKSAGRNNQADVNILKHYTIGGN